MTIKIEMFPANEGDSFLITLGEDHKYNIIIDGGREETYDNFLEKRLTEIAKEGGKIDLLIVTHIDEDHIEGILKLFSSNGSSKAANVIKINEVWHNSYRHLEIEKIDKKDMSPEEREILGDLISTFSSNRKRINNNENVDISAKQGSSLAAYLYGGDYSWNSMFDYRAVNVDQRNYLEINKDIKIRILSPDKKKLNGLRKKWRNQLNSTKLGIKFSDDDVFDDAFEFYLRSSPESESIDENDEISHRETKLNLDKLSKVEGTKDNSATNGSSISFIIEYNDKYKLLFLADSHSDIIVDNLKKLSNEENYDLTFDVVKIAHHGSERNNTSLLLNLINSKNYLISTDGTNGHPDLSTIAKIITKDISTPKTIYFNYKNKQYHQFNNSELKSTFNYEIISQSELSSTIIPL
ncbi:MBL fold metallo-hydrolase [Paenibacillus allorhizoplanae]|nr:MBL fold metallo-hydrolase [Paenibacillus allorhizoplanae]